MKRGDRPTVVFIDDGALWHSFHHVAALVRRQGCQTIRVTTAQAGPLTRLNDKLLYHRAVYLSDVAEFGDLADMLKPFRLTHVYTTEPILDLMPDRVIDELPDHITAELRRCLKFGDKTHAAAVAADCGVLAPEQIPASVPPAVVVEKLGLPVVLKRKLGAAGAGVRIAATLAEVESVLAALGPVDDVFYERFVPGRVVTYCAMVGAEGAVQELTYQSIQVGFNPTGAPMAYEVTHDSELLAIGRAMCQGVGARGPVNVQTILDENGDHWMIDLNIRPFGGMLDLDQNAIDSAAGYLYAAGLSAELPIHRTAPDGLRVLKYPNDCEEFARSGRYGQALRVYLRRSPAYRRVLGLNYIVFALVNGVANKLHI